MSSRYRAPDPRREPAVGRSEELDNLAARVTRNGPTQLAPELFHIEKSEIAAALRRIAREERGEPRREATTTWRPSSKAAAGL